MSATFPTQFAVVPILVGPLQVLLAMLPAILIGIGSALLALFKPATFKLALRLLWRLKVSVIIFVVLVGGTVYAARAIRRHSGGTVRKAEAATSDWPMFRAGPRRTGAAPDAVGPLDGGINWAFASEAKTFYSSPTIVGNRVYANSAEVSVFSNRGAIYCLDADTGGVVWKSVPEGFRATFSSPSISGKYLVTGEGLHQTRDGRVNCLDITRNGALLWSFRTKSHVESSPAIANGRAYVGAGDDGHYCIRLEPDAQGNPVVIWHLPTEKYPDAETSPVVHEGCVYFGLGIGGHAIVCVEAETGKELWRVPTPYPVFAPPTIAKGKVFVGMGHGNFVEAEEEVIAAELERLRTAGKTPEQIEEAKKTLQTGGEAWCIDLATHKVEWQFKTDRTVLGAVVAGEHRVFIPSRGGTVYSVGYDGKPHATWNAHSPIIASLALTASHVYAVTENGHLFALEQAGLTPVWETVLGEGGQFLSSPGVARGHIYVGSPEGGLLCAGNPPVEQSVPQIWAGHLGGAGVCGHLDDSTLPERGESIWRWPKEGSPAETITAPSAAIDNRLFVPLAGSGRNGVGCLPAGSRSREAPAEAWFFKTSNPVTSSPAASGKAVAFIDGSAGMTSRRLHFVNSAAGSELWSAEVKPDAQGMICLTKDAVLAETDPGWLTSFDWNGATRWRASLDSATTMLAGTPAVVDSMVIATTARELLVLDEIEGKPLWRATPNDPSTTGPVIRKTSIVFGTATGISAHSILDGKPRWHAAVGPIRAALASCGEFLAAVTSSGKLVILDGDTGEIRATQEGAIPDMPPLPAADALLYATPAGLMRYDLAKKTAAPWMPTTGLGTLTSPMILSASSVYFATDKPAFIRAAQPAP